MYREHFENEDRNLLSSHSIRMGSSGRSAGCSAKSDPFIFLRSQTRHFSKKWYESTNESRSRHDVRVVELALTGGGA